MEDVYLVLPTMAPLTKWHKDTLVIYQHTKYHLILETPLLVSFILL